MAQSCADNAHQRCARLQSCSATDMQLRYGTERACETRETANCTAGLTAPMNGNTPAAVEACASAYAAWACEDYLDNQNVPQPCQQQLGPVVNGGSCAVGWSATSRNGTRISPRHGAAETIFREPMIGPVVTLAGLVKTVMALSYENRERTL